MSLSGALGIAQSALANNSAQAALLSTNIANVSNTNYARRSVQSVTQIGGGVQAGPTQRATDDALLTNLLAAQANSTSQQSLSDGLTQIASTLNLDSTSTSSSATATDTSPATLMAALSTALQQYAAQPDNPSLATAAVSAAKALADEPQFNPPSTVQSVRSAGGHGASRLRSQTINSLLTQFKTVNDANRRRNAGTGADTTVTPRTRATAFLKQPLERDRDQRRSKGSKRQHCQIYTDSGVTCSSRTTPRTVSVQCRPAACRRQHGGAAR